MKSKKINRFFAELSDAKSLILVFVCFILVPSCVMVYFYYARSSGIIEHEVIQSILQTLKQTDINLENRLDVVEKISESIFTNQEVMDFVGSGNNDDIPLQAQQAQDIRELINGEIGNDTSLGIRLYISKDKMVSSENVNFFPVENIMGQSWYKPAVAKKGGLVWTDVYTNTYLGDGTAQIISCARVLKHKFNYNDNEGILLVDIRESSLYSILSTVRPEKGVQLFLVDGDGRAISCEDKSNLGKAMVDKQELAFLNSTASGEKGFKEIGRDKTLIFQTVENTGWKLVYSVDKADIIKTNLIFNNISVFVLIIVSFVIFVFGIFLIVIQVINRINRQLKKLADEIKREGLGSFSEAKGKTSGRDYVRFETYVYEMIRQVKALMEETYQSELRAEEAKLTALQAQINPHFLYNTLDAVNWMAVKIDAKEISLIVNSLAKYFRLSLSKGKTVVNISDELELIKVYLAIQNTRYKNSIQSVFHIADDVENYAILKLTLQPIVENAILHGIQKKKDRSGLITVDAVKQGEDILITITDDGVGMDEKTRKDILLGLTGSQNGHYGLFNVNERINLFYGKGYGLFIESEPGKGTKVIVKIRAMQ